MKSFHRADKRGLRAERSLEYGGQQTMWRDLYSDDVIRDFGETLLEQDRADEVVHVVVSRRPFVELRVPLTLWK